MPSLPLYLHQHESIQRALRRNGSFALFAEPGLGKSRTALEIFSRLREQTPDLHMLVVCPLSLVEAVWKTEVEAYTPFRWCALKRYDRAADVFVVNYEILSRAAGKRLLEESGILTHPVLLCLDESSRLKDPRSLTTKTCLALAARCVVCFFLSGTTESYTLAELWPQIKVVEPTAVHKSFWAWRRTYFHLARGTKTLPDVPPDRRAMQQLFQSGWRWNITQANQDRLLTTIAPLCHWVKKEAALNLPEKIITQRDVYLSSVEWQAYETMRKALVVEFESETITAELALTKLLRLRQLSSGFLYGQTIRHHTGTSRLAVLQETLEELGPQPVIIWAQFHEEIEQIATALGERAVTLYSKTKDRDASLKQFGKEAQYLIAHPRSAGHGLTLTQASAAVWFSLDWSLEAYSPANDRIHRLGQTRSCLYTHLMAKGPQRQETIDDQLWAVLQQKRTLQEAIDQALGVHATLRSGITSADRGELETPIPIGLHSASV